MQWYADEIDAAVKGADVISISGKSARHDKVFAASRVAPEKPVSLAGLTRHPVSRVIVKGRDMFGNNLRIERIRADARQELAGNDDAALGQLWDWTLCWCSKNGSIEHGEQEPYPDTEAC
jgi:hypothetical protein